MNQSTSKQFKKSFIVRLAILTFGLLTVASPAFASSPMDSYANSNKDTNGEIYSGSYWSQSFTGNGTKILDVHFFLAKTAFPTGNAYVKIYAHSGTFGTSSVPTGSALATSDAVDVSTLTGTFTDYTFTFTGGSQYLTTAGTKYTAVLEFTSGDGSNLIRFGLDHSAPTHSGNAATYGGSWNALSGGYDAPFIVTGEDIPGCTDPAADNYDPTATVDDDSCSYPLPIGFFTSTVSGGTTTYELAETGWYVVNSLFAVLEFGFAFITLLFSIWFFYHKSRY